MTDVFEELEKRIAAKKKEVEEEERALAILKRTMARGPVPQEIDNSATWGDRFKFEDLLGSVEKSRKRTLISDVREVISQFGNNEFTVVYVEAALEKKGIVLDAKSPRARISIALAKLVEDGTVIKVGEGGGNIPHRYKLKNDSSDSLK